MSGDVQEGYAVLAVVIRPQGRKGEVLAELLTDFPETLPGRAGLMLGKEDQPDQARPCTITDAWMPKGRNEGRVVLAFEGVSTISEAEALAGQAVLVPLHARMPLPDDAMYVSELEGASVWDGERRIGVIREVRFPAGSDGRRQEESAPLLVLAPEGDAAEDDDENEVLIPFVKEFLVRLDREGRAVHMRLPDGLADGGA